MNIPLIKAKAEQYCKFDDPSKVYLLVLLARKKENPDLTEKHKLEKCNRYVVHSVDDIPHALSEMEKKAGLYPDIKFRVYLSVNRRCLKKGFGHVSWRLAQLSMDLLNGNQQAYTTLARLGSEWKSVLAEKPCRAERRFLFDVDFSNKTEEGQLAYSRFLDTLYPLSVTIHHSGPTLNGYAVITDPFNINDLGGLPEHVELKSDDYLYLGVLNND